MVKLTSNTTYGYLTGEGEMQSSRGEALGQSEVFLDFQERLSRVAPVDRPVLLIGERGTGKELAASRLHYLSKRWKGPFITLNCATLSPSLIEAELFGHEKGAFTGADARRTGRFEAANGGTLFLDEIGSIPMEAQEKILRVVEYGSFERVGNSIPIEVDVRIVGATNVDLSDLAEKEHFKRDLLDRLSFEVLFLPPLRYRGEDIMLLANHFAQRISYELGRDDIPAFSNAAEEALEKYSWNGNIRELKNVIERAVYRSDDNMIDEIVFNPFRSPYEASIEPSPTSEHEAFDKLSGIRLRSAEQPVTFKMAIRELEITLLKKALQSANHNQKKAASYLDLSYDQFRGLLRKYSSELS
jgi:psp operon transcriptional activator